MGIKSRLSIAFLGIAALTIALVGGLGLLTLRALISSTELDLAARARAEFLRAVEERAADNEALARMLAELPGVQERVRNDDRGGLLADLGPAFAALRAYGINNTHFHRPNMTTLVRLHAPSQYDDDLSTTRPMIAEAIRTRTPRRGIELGVNGLPIRGAVPLVGRDGAPLGAVEVGSFIDDDFLRGLAAPDATYIVFFAKSENLQTFAASPNARAPRLEKAALQEAKSDVSFRSQVGDATYLSTAVPLLDYSGRSVGVVQIDIDTTRLENAYDTAIYRLLLGVLGLGLLAAVIGILTALGIIRPMGRLIRTAEQIAGDAPTAPVPFVSQPDELGRFARAIDEFRRSKELLQARTADLDELNRRYVAEREAALAAMHLLQDIIDTVPAIINFKGLDLRYVMVNRECARFYNRTREEMIGKRISEVNSDFNVEALEAAEKQVLETGEALVPSEFSGVSAARGDYGTWWTIKAPFRDQQGKIGGIVTVAIDITDLKQAHAILERRRSDLEAANRRLAKQATDLERLNVQYQAEREAAREASRVKSEFLANMSHELRTPLNAVIGYSEILLKQMFGPLPPRYLDYTGDILASGRHLLDVINDILDMSRIESGKHNLLIEPVDVQALMQSAIRFVEERAATKKQELRLTIAEPVPPMVVDARAIKQVMLNLVGNAVKFTQPGGRIEVDVRSQPDGRLAIAVRDNGPGIEAHHLPHVLKPFWQAEEARRRTHEGTGLGLSISSKLVELHGGELDISSTVGRGTVVTVRLPSPALALNQVTASANSENGE